MRTPSTEYDRLHGVLHRGGASGRPTVAIVDLSALEHNFKEVSKRVGGRAVLAVVKAEAYGHGAVAVSRHLVGLGADMLGVALVEEGAELREAGIDVPILVMGAVFPEQADEIVRLGLSPVVYTDGLARALSSAADARRRDVQVHVKIDTGMGRIGLMPESALDFISRIWEYPRLCVAGLMTHFADADLKDKEFALCQIERFEGLIDALDHKGLSVPLRHAANSAAVLEFGRGLFNMVRPGLMLYGCNPLESGSSGREADLRPVMSLVTRIAFIKKVGPGTPISYGRTFVTKRESLIATIPIGYADGYSRSLSNKGEALVGGRRVPVVGRVCMDMTMIDVTDVPGVAEGDEAVLMGSQGNERITAEEIAAKTGTIPYEVLCGISSRVPRVYVQGK